MRVSRRPALLTYSRGVPTEVFRDDDAGYERWLELHPSGFVLNTRRTPRRSYVRSHTARCPHITRLHPGYTTWTGGGYIKVCADSIQELDSWTEREVGARSERSCGCWA